MSYSRVKKSNNFIYSSIYTHNYVFILKIIIFSCAVFLTIFYALKLFTEVRIYFTDANTVNELVTDLQDDAQYNDLFVSLENDLAKNLDIEDEDHSGAGYLDINKIIDEDTIIYNDLESLENAEDGKTVSNEIAHDKGHAHHEDHDHNHQYFQQNINLLDDVNIQVEILSIADALIIDKSNPKNSNHNKEHTNIGLGNQKNKNLDVMDHKVIKDARKLPSSFVNTGDNKYVLSITDAIDLNGQVAIKTNDRVKKEIKLLYKNRKELTKKARILYVKSTKDIKKIKYTLRKLGVAVPNKFKKKISKISKSKVLKDLNMTFQELAWRHPKLKSNLETLARLRAYISFMPIHPPIYNARRSSSFGWRRDPFTKRSRKHSGMDYAARKGKPLVASGVGVIKYAGRRGGYGNVVEIYHSRNVFTRYAHLSKIFVKKGQRVAIGQKIGAVGSTGRSTGPHLHYEIRIRKKAVNPVNFLSKRKYLMGILNKYL